MRNTRKNIGIQKRSVLIDLIEMQLGHRISLNREERIGADSTIGMDLWKN